MGPPCFFLLRNLWILREFHFRWGTYGPVLSERGGGVIEHLSAGNDGIVGALLSVLSSIDHGEMCLGIRILAVRYLTTGAIALSSTPYFGMSRLRLFMESFLEAGYHAHPFPLAFVVF